MPKVEQMARLFPECPVCKSKEGYRLSVFYPNIQCVSCKAEWLLYEDGLELKAESKEGWGDDLLGKKFPFEFWKEPKLRFSPKEESILKERIFAPMDYMGGHMEYRKPAIGYILVAPEAISYEAGEGSLNKMNVHIPIEDFKGIEVRTSEEITFARWVLIGGWSILFKAKKEYLVLIYEDRFKMLQHMVFDFHQQRKNADELMNLVSYFKKKQTEATSG
jgi:hypothetical protein